jgi:maleylacetate reductase
MVQQGEFTYRAIEHITFGRPCVEVLLQEIERLAARHVFLIAGRSLANSSDLVARLESALGARHAGTHIGIPPHTPRDAALAAANSARRAGTDLLVTLGGGSVTDAGKIVQICLRHAISEVDGLDPFRSVVHEDGQRSVPEFAAPEVRQVAIPATLSGAEFNGSAGCTNPRLKAKEIFVHPALVPRHVILDPEVTRTTPEWLWISSGVRAVDNAVEALCSPLSNAHSDATSLQALRLLGRGLPASRDAPRDLAARLDCQMGVWLSMDHLQSGIQMGASHAIGHVLGGTCGVPHGHTSCVMLPAVMEYNCSVNADRQRLVSAAFGRPDVPAATVLADFIAGLGLPRRLADVGVSPAQFRQIAELSMHDHFLHTNPRPITSPEQVMEILRLAA